MRAAFLFCGGLGTRLRAVTDRPKAVVPVAGWPFLRYHLERLRGSDVSRIVFLTGHGADEVEKVFGPERMDEILGSDAAGEPVRRSQCGSSLPRSSRSAPAVRSPTPERSPPTRT